jgi:hypothetical protein
MDVGGCVSWTAASGGLSSHSKTAALSSLIQRRVSPLAGDKRRFALVALQKDVRRAPDVEVGHQCEPIPQPWEARHADFSSGVSTQVMKLRRRVMSRFSIKADTERTIGFGCP